MTLYALLKYNPYFSRGAALSPSLWTGGADIPAFIKESKPRRNTLLYTDYGSKEFSNHSNQRALFAKTAATLIEKGVAVTASVVAGGTHCEASWEKRVPVFMELLGFLPED